MKIDGSTLAATLDRYCEENGIIKKDLFEKTGLSSATLSQWRTGVYNPSVRRIKELEATLNINIAELTQAYGLVQQKKATTEIGDGLTKDEKAVIALYRLLNPDTRREVTALLLSLAQEQ